jgi:hypothetical protein
MKEVSMLFWLLLAAMLPNDRPAQLAAAVGCGVYFVLAASTPASPVSVIAQEVA